ncbi:MAG: phosphoserine transaminase [Pseudomonadota bacterium]
MPDTPVVRPNRPDFSSGPCAKPPTWALSSLKTDALGRSHRSKIGKARLKACIDETRALLGVPDDYRIGIVPASDTGALEMAMWTMLGARPVTVTAWESFGKGWVTDAVKQLKIDPVVLEADYGTIPDLTTVDPSHDVVFTWNGTTSGAKVPNADWIADDREGLTICDATSAVFAMDLPWHKLDVTTYSWQKVLGGEAAHGVIILSPRAVERLESYTPSWPLPKIFRLTKGGKLIEGIFRGETINTPSMLCVEDCLLSLDWARSVGGLEGMIARSEANLAAIESWVDTSSWASFLAAEKPIRSNTSVCLKVSDADVAGWDAEQQAALPKRMSALLEAETVAYDIGGYRDAPPGLRIWCGATVETADVEALLPWLDWAFATAKAELSS